MKPSLVDSACAARDYNDPLSRLHHDRQQSLSSSVIVLLRIVERPESADLSNTYRVEIKQNGGSY